MYEETQATQVALDPRTGTAVLGLEDSKSSTWAPGGPRGTLPPSTQTSTLTSETFIFFPNLFSALSFASRLLLSPQRGQSSGSGEAEQRAGEAKGGPFLNVPPGQGLGGNTVHIPHVGGPERVPQAAHPSPDSGEWGRKQLLLTRSDLCQALCQELRTHDLISSSCHPWVGRTVTSNLHT